MDIHLIWKFVCILIYSNVFVITGIPIKTVWYRIHHKQLNTRRCAIEIQNNDTYVGALVRNTGECQKVLQYLNGSQIKDLRNFYMEKVKYSKEFQPPLTPSRDIEDMAIHFPGHLTTGSKLEFLYIRNPLQMCMFNIGTSYFQDRHDIEEYWINITVDESTSSIDFLGNLKQLHKTSFNYEMFCPLPECNFAIVVQEEYLEITANDRAIPDGKIEIPLAISSKMKSTRIDLFLNGNHYGYGKFQRFKFTR